MEPIIFYRTEGNSRGNALRISGNLSVSSAFTLVELMAAMAVMAIVLVVAGSVISNASKFTGASNKRMDTDSEARMIFDRMDGDFSRLVNRSDVDYMFTKQAGNDSLFFYSEAPALPASSTAMNNSSVSLVGYRINSNNQLERFSQGLLWTGNPSMVFLSYSTGNPDSNSTLSGAFSSIFSTNSNYQVLGEDVFRLEFCFLLKSYLKSDGTTVPAYYSNLPYNTRLPTDATPGPGHTSIYGGTGLSDVQAIVMTMALLDSASRKILPVGVNWSLISGALPDPVDTDLAATTPLLPARTWQAVVDSGSIATAASIPQTAASQIRVYQRIFALIPSSP